MDMCKMTFSKYCFLIVNDQKYLSPAMTIQKVKRYEASII